MNNFEIKPVHQLTNLEPDQTEALGPVARSRRPTLKKTERDDPETLRRRIAVLEAENRSLYQHAFQLQQSLETTGASEKELTTFISTVAHELRTPLTSIKGYIDLVLEGEAGEINDVQREFLAIVGANSNRLASIIGDLLDVSRLETGRTVFKPFLTELVSLCQTLTESVRPQFEAKNINFKPEIPLGGRLEMLADRDRLLQALRALLAQAGLLTSQGGTVSFTLSRGFEPHQAEIVISDDGPLIAPQDLPRLFTKFFRPSFSDPGVDYETYGGTVVLEPENGRENSNTGLGMAIAKAIIEMHQGQVEVESEEGLGNRFVVTLPLLYSAGSEIAAERWPITQPSLLVVSQDKGFVETMQIILKSEGFQVVVAKEREEVMAATPAWQPDLIIENGLELGHEAKVRLGDQPLDVTRRTALLNLSLSELEQRAFRAGALAVLPWPSDEMRLKFELIQLLASELEGQALSNFMETSTVLLVSPQTNILRSFDKMLHEFGHKRIFRATMVSDALALARRYRPNLLFVTAGPDSDSIALFEELYSDPLLHTTPAVVFTPTENIAASVPPAYQTGSNQPEGGVASDNNKNVTLNTLPKPLTRQRLVSVIRRLTFTN